jgi:hypothetical protein
MTQNEKSSLFWKFIKGIFIPFDRNEFEQVAIEQANKSFAVFPKRVLATIEKQFPTTSFDSINIISVTNYDEKIIAETIACGEENRNLPDFGWNASAATFYTIQAIESGNKIIHILFYLENPMTEEWSLIREKVVPFEIVCNQVWSLKE